MATSEGAEVKKYINIHENQKLHLKDQAKYSDKTDSYQVKTREASPSRLGKKKKN